MKNSILILHPYKFFDQWVFDDEKTGLVREAFISGIDAMLDKLTEDIEDADRGFQLLFSTNPFPGFQIQLDCNREEYGGNWYWCESLQLEGWLCPALYKYFEVAPKKIYAQVKPATRNL
jgi:hypothetical protein